MSSIGTLAGLLFLLGIIVGVYFEITERKRLARMAENITKK